ncbi:hypothetical protein N7474_002890 [Penicillium riverlandense]|uniref:uncharacterized protein n=1 Tax=Penicillium riverlandense TaxID=1903569 RepID=UPI00254921E6|nr:uncharacterized protein N7474_002890 [Penicillium riverlandense]KAJ5825752.1 hypothetical protein N7474_002890 [Penicillium riverlandense]
MLARTYLYLSATAALTGLSAAQTNITAGDCAASDGYTSCNADVANQWSSCVNGCNGDGDCSVNCGCTAHQRYINCMAESCWNQVYSCEYQLFVQQYFSICPDAVEPIPFWPAPDDAPRRCSCSLGKVLQSTLSARKEIAKCISNVTSDVADDLSNLNALSGGLDIARQATECACCGASASISAAWEVCPNTDPVLAGADLWGVFFPTDLPDLYRTVPNWSWDSCDATLGDISCPNVGFADPSDKFYQPNNLPKNGTATLSNVAGTVTAPPSGTIITWSQSSTTWTITASGYNEKAVAQQSQFRATATGTDAFATQTGTNAAAGTMPTDMVAALGGVLGVVVLAL